MRCQQELERTGDLLRQSLEVSVNEREQLEHLHQSMSRQLDELSVDNDRLQSANNDLQRHRNRLQDEKDDLFQEQERQNRERERWYVHLYTTNLPDSITLGGAFNVGGASQGQVIC